MLSMGAGDMTPPILDVWLKFVHWLKIKIHKAKPILKPVPNPEGVPTLEQ
jgi:hypothetical protein